MAPPPPRNLLRVHNNRELQQLVIEEFVDAFPLGLQRHRHRGLHRDIRVDDGHVAILLLVGGVHHEEQAHRPPCHDILAKPAVEDDVFGVRV